MVRHDLQTHLNLPRGFTGSLVRISMITSFGSLGIETVGSSIIGDDFSFDLISEIDREDKRGVTYRLVDEDSNC